MNKIVVDANKRAIRPWKQYQSRLITPEEFQAQQADSRAFGVAVICGAISGNIEVIDVDTKYSLTPDFNKVFLAGIPAELLAKLYIVTTKSGGMHLYYSCTEIAGNLKLAQRHTTAEERAANPNDKVRVLIETRGEGGYVVAPPTPGYTVLQGTEPQPITPAERECLLDYCRSFNMVFEVEKDERQTVAADGFHISPFEDYNARGVDDMLQELYKAGWKHVADRNGRTILKRPGHTTSSSSGDFWHEKGWFSVFTTSTQFEPGKAYKPAAVICKLLCNDDWSACARLLLEKGYGERRTAASTKIMRDVFRKKEEGATSDEIANFVAKRHNIPADESQKIVAQLEAQWGKRVCTFWEVNEKGAISIVRYKLVNFLAENGGFGIYYYDKNSTIYKLIQIVDGFVEEVSTEQIKKFVQNYVHGLPDSFDGITGAELLEVLYKGADTYFSKSFLEFLPRIKLNLLKDTPDAAHFCFQNGVVKITRDKFELLTYKEANAHVWRSQVIPFNIDIDESVDLLNTDFVRFMQKVCMDDIQRIEYLFSITGYLLHKYKSPTRPYAVILGEEVDNEKEGGGTGKGLYFKAISKLLNVIFVDGKNFKMDKSFAFQRVSLDTQLVVIEDCRKNVDFEAFYSGITEGLTLEKKNKDELYIPYADSPKFGFTTNYSIQLTGNHAKRRAKVVEFGNFFHPRNTPYDYFGHNLFDDWDADEWNRFYNVMFECVQHYLKNGISETYSSESMKRKQIKLNYTEEFLDWVESTSESMKVSGQWYLFSDLYNEFLSFANIERREYSQKRLKSGIETYCDLFGICLQERKNHQHNGKKELFFPQK
jgi:hypothetical protein